MKQQWKRSLLSLGVNLTKTLPPGSFTAVWRTASRAPVPPLCGREGWSGLHKAPSGAGHRPQRTSTPPDVGTEVPPTPPVRHLLAAPPSGRTLQRHRAKTSRLRNSSVCLDAARLRSCSTPQLRFPQYLILLLMFYCHTNAVLCWLVSEAANVVALSCVTLSTTLLYSLLYVSSLFYLYCLIGTHQDL